MLNKLFLATAATAALGAGAAMAAEGETLAQVKSRGVLNCGVNTGLVGFAAPDANGNWSGFDIAICKAVAAAVLGDASKVKYVPTTGQTRFTALSSGEVDVLARNSTWTFQRDTDLKLDFAGVNYYDGQGFIAKKSLNVKSALELSGAAAPIGWAMLGGAFVFGAAMQVVLGCGSGTLVNAGSGNAVAVVALPFFILGSFLGSWKGRRPGLGCCLLLQVSLA